MLLSSTLCRAQESLHLRRAAGTSLDNVRVVATNAAQAWAQEAIAAERREQRQIRINPDARDALSPSENPDRGRANA